MLRIKTFEFQISCWAGSRLIPNQTPKGMTAFREMTISSTSEIDEKINEFIQYCTVKEWEIKDIKIDHYTLHRHNNGYDDTIIAKYTIIYNEKPLNDI